MQTWLIVRMVSNQNYFTENCIKSSPTSIAQRLPIPTLCTLWPSVGGGDGSGYYCNYISMIDIDIQIITIKLYID